MAEKSKPKAEAKSKEQQILDKDLVLHQEGLSKSRSVRSSMEPSGTDGQVLVEYSSSMPRSLTGGC